MRFGLAGPGGPEKNLVLMNELTPAEVQEIDRRIRSELRKVIVGQDEIVQLLLVSLFARGHCLLVGVPGLAKTLLVAVARRGARRSASSASSSPRT